MEPTKGAFTYWTVDQNVAALKASGLPLWLVMGYNNPAYAPSASAPITGASLQAYLAYFSKTLQRYKGRGWTFEVANEPDGAWFWSDTSPAWYADLCVAALRARNAVAPGERVAIGTSGTVNLVYLQAVLQRIGAKLTPEEVGAVVIAPHGYDSKGPLNLLVSWPSFVSLVRSVPSLQGASLAVGEVGFPSTINKTPSGIDANGYSASLLYQWVLAARAVQVPLAIMYVLNGRPAEVSNSALATDGSPLPLMDVLTSWSARQ